MGLLNSKRIFRDLLTKEHEIDGYARSELIEKETWQIIMLHYELGLPLSQKEIIQQVISSYNCQHI